MTTLDLNYWIMTILIITKNVLRNFAKLTGKYLYQSLFFNKVTGLRPVTLLKRDSVTGVFL